MASAAERCRSPLLVEFTKMRDRKDSKLQTHEVASADGLVLMTGHLGL